MYQKSIKRYLAIFVAAAMILTSIPVAMGLYDADAASKPAAPAEFSGLGSSKTSIKLKWSKVKGASKYVVYRDGKKVGETSKTTYTNKGLKKDKVYDYKVRAKNRKGLGKSSYVISVKPRKSAAGKKSNVTRVKINSSKVVLSLDAGKTKNLNAAVSPSSKVVSKRVTWTSDDTSVATVGKYGVVTPKGVGSCTVYARSHNGKTAKCKVDVAGEEIMIKNAEVAQIRGDVQDPEAVVIKGDEIVYVGSNEGAAEYETENTTVIDAEGKTVMPTMTDSHLHISIAGASYLYEIPLYDIGYKKDMLEVIEGFIADNPDLEVYVGAGWIVSAFGQSGPDKKDLDKICSDKPVILTSADGHSTWVNSKALEVAGITKDTPQPEAGEIIKDANGEPTGYLREGASDLVADLSPEYTKEQMRDAILWTQDWLAAKGFTTVFNAGMTCNEESDINYFAAMEELAEEGELTLRVRDSWWIQPYMFETWAECEDYLSQCLKVAKQCSTNQYQVNTLKIMVDQVLEEGTAYMEEGYYIDPEDPSKGKEVLENGIVWKGKEDILKNAMTYAEKNGMQIHIHQKGDGAADYALDILEEMSASYPELKDHRVCFAHCQFIDEEDQARMKELGVSLLTAPYWAVMDDYYWDLYAPYVGTEILEEQYPMKTPMENGINVAFHSDWFVTEPDMGWLFYSAMTRTLPQKIYDLWYGGYEEYYYRTTDPDVKAEDHPGQMLIGPNNPDEKLSLEQTMEAATINGAYSMFLDDVTGSLEPGKKADLLILDRDISGIDIEDMENIGPEVTIFGGKVIYNK